MAFYLNKLCCVTRFLHVNIYGSIVSRKMLIDLLAFSCGNSLKLSENENMRTTDRSVLYIGAITNRAYSSQRFKIEFMEESQQL